MGDGGASGVPHGALLVEFAEALHVADPARQVRARKAVASGLGDAALVDAAAIVASFNAVVKIADATGIPLEAYKAAATEDLRRDLALERFNRNAGAG